MKKKYWMNSETSVLPYYRMSIILQVKQVNFPWLFCSMWQVGFATQGLPILRAHHGSADPVIRYKALQLHNQDGKVFFITKCLFSCLHESFEIELHQHKE